MPHTSIVPYTSAKILYFWEEVQGGFRVNFLKRGNISLLTLFEQVLEQDEEV